MLVIFSLVSAGVAVALHAVFRRLVPPEDLLPHHDVAGFLVSIVGVLYAVVLGFLVINVWASFDLAQRNADAETNDLSTILHLAKAFPEPARSQTQRLIARYAFEVRDREWPMLSHGEEDTQARAIMFDAFNVVATMQPAQKASPAEDLQLASLRDAA
ncbi:MAG TPA: hypothetical protein VEJ41_07535, partial [Candidatus Acidoferrales bacterium]|nr:hypothetical protein [Candidatus Acidoferrales bacterium]